MRRELLLIVSMMSSILCATKQVGLPTINGVRTPLFTLPHDHLAFIPCTKPDTLLDKLLRAAPEYAGRGALRLMSALHNKDIVCAACGSAISGALVSIPLGYVLSYVVPEAQLAVPVVASIMAGSFAGLQAERALQNTPATDDTAMHLARRMILFSRQSD